MKLLATRVALSYVGLPYLWGGNSPVSGFDCSGLVAELMRVEGVLGPADLSAQMLYDYLESRGEKSVAQEGAVVFFGPSTLEINHVGYMIDEWRMVEAAGGGREVTTGDVAAKLGACVRVRFVNYRKDYLGAIMPRYTVVGG